MPKNVFQPKVDNKTEPQQKRNKFPVNQVSLQREPPASNCSLCGGDRHPLYLCPSYKAMAQEQRHSDVKENQLCYNCLSRGHKTKDCKSSHRCYKCSKHHHTSLHRDTQSVNATQTPNSPPTVDQSSSTSFVASLSPASINSSVSTAEATLQMTSQMVIQAPNGKQLLVRALLDTGASISLITRKVTKLLQLKGDSHKFNIVGAQGVDTGTATGSATFMVKAVNSESSPLSLTAAIVPKVTCDLPLQGASGVKSLPHIKELQLADPHFDKPGRIDLLVGCNILRDILDSEIRRGDKLQPIARKTTFGWVIMGRYSPDERKEVKEIAMATCHTDTPPSLDDLLKRFWETEEISKFSPCYTPEEKQVLKHYETNHSFLSTVGRYQVKLPKKSGESELGESRQQAVKRFFSNERNLKIKGTLQNFNDVVKEYIDLGHAEPVPLNEAFYMPMHGVHKESSSTTKLRVVFDASAKSSSGVSLNGGSYNIPLYY